MTNEEAVEKLKILKEDYWDDDGYGHESKLYDDTVVALDMAIKALSEERKKGRWIVIAKMDGRTRYECSVCGKNVIYDDLMDLAKYCDYCGAKMEGSEKG